MGELSSLSTLSDQQQLDRVVVNEWGGDFVCQTWSSAAPRNIFAPRWALLQD